jgi:hypothetical protein
MAKNATSPATETTAMNRLFRKYVPIAPSVKTVT